MNLALKIILLSVVLFIALQACNNDELITPEILPQKTLISRFEFNKTTLNSEIETIFNDVSTGNVTSRKWLIEGANISNSEGKSPAVTFLDFGMVEVGLIVFDEDTNTSDTSFQELVVYPGKGLVAYFPIDSMAFDESGNDFHGVITGTELHEDVNGKSNSARSFLDYTDYITSSSGISEFLNEGATFAAWIKPLDTIDIGEIVGNVASSSATNNTPLENSNGAGFRFTFGTYDYRGLGLVHRTSDEDRNYWNSGENQQVEINSWAHALSTWNGKVDFAESEINIYIDAIYSNDSGGSASSNNNDLYVNSTDPLIIGSKYLRNKFNCVIDEVRIYNRVLDEEEIAFLQNYKM